MSSNGMIVQYRDRIFVLSVFATFGWIYFSLLPVIVGWIGSFSPWAEDTLLHNDAVKMFITLPIVCVLAYPLGRLLSNLIMVGLPINDTD